MGKRNSTSTKGRSRWKSSSENYLLIAEVRFRLRVRISIWVRIQRPFSTRTAFGGCRIASSMLNPISHSWPLINPNTNFDLRNHLQQVMATTHFKNILYYLPCFRPEHFSNNSNSPRLTKGRFETIYTVKCKQ